MKLGSAQKVAVTSCSACPVIRLKRASERSIQQKYAGAIHHGTFLDKHFAEKPSINCTVLLCSVRSILLMLHQNLIILIR